MRKIEMMEVVSAKSIAKETMELTLYNEHISETAKPGQFLHISVPGHTLRRPISIAHVDKRAKKVKILFKIIGSGTKKLASFQQGERLDVLGPNGSGFPIENIEPEASVLLVGGGIGVPPLYFLARELKEKNVSLQIILGFQAKEYMFYEREFQELGTTFIVTNDGSYGEKGLVTDLFERLAPFSRYYSCGPLPMLKAVKNELISKEGYLSFEERMGCGVGACYACVVPTFDETGYKKICSDGPVFKANEVNL